MDSLLEETEARNRVLCLVKAIKSTTGWVCGLPDSSSGTDDFAAASQRMTWHVGSLLVATAIEPFSRVKAAGLTMRCEKASC
jgi:hypothetical protein